MTEPKTSHFQEIERYRSDVPDGYVYKYEQLLAENCTPRVAAAAVDYMASVCEGENRTQQEVADEHDVHIQTIRKWQATLLEEPPQRLQGRPDSDFE